MEHEPEAFAGDFYSALATNADVLEALGRHGEADEIRRLLRGDDEDDRE